MQYHCTAIISAGSADSEAVSKLQDAKTKAQPCWVLILTPRYLVSAVLECSGNC